MLSEIFAVSEARKTPVHGGDESLESLVVSEAAGFVAVGQAPHVVAVGQAPEVMAVAYDCASPCIAQLTRLADRVPW